MTPKLLPTSLPTRVRCPVCNQAVYSRAGIHPQCAVKQADPPRTKVKAKAPAPTEENKSSSQAPKPDPNNTSARPATAKARR